MSTIKSLFYILSLLIFSQTWATTFVLPTSGDLIGKIKYVHPEMGETLSEVGIRYDIGFYEMVRANPQIDPARPLSAVTRLIIPAQFILPNGPRVGLVINLAEYRLYFFPSDDNIVITMPVGIGREGWTTPTGITKIIAKEQDPIWKPTPNVRAEAAKHGMPIPHIFPPGEGNPLGRHVLRLGWPTYLIHGTNRRDGVGSRVSAGCIRMMPEDIEYLFGFVSKGTQVRVINQPVKLGFFHGQLYLQAHPSLAEHRANLKHLAEQQLIEFSAKNINHKLLSTELINPSGIPKKITL